MFSPVQKVRTMTVWVVRTHQRKTIGIFKKHLVTVTISMMYVAIHCIPRCQIVDNINLLERYFPWMNDVSS